MKGEKGEAIIASVSVVNRPDKAVQTSIDGHFLIKVNEGDVLVFSAIGYEPHSRTVKGDEQVTITLKKTEKPIKVIDNSRAKAAAVSGVVKAASDNEPLVGVTISIKGADNQSTVSDLNGKFSLKAKDGDILLVRYIGYETEEVPVTGNATMEILLEESNQSLEEVVVVGYSTVSKQTITGAVSALGSSRISESLAGTVPGVMAENALSEAESMGTISLKGWEADAPYMTELRAKADKDMYAAYIAIRKEYQTAPSFYLDVVTLFEERGMKEEAFLILSNLAEMKLEDYRVLRVLAHRLQQLGYVDYAIRIFEKVKELRPEEAQSYRDLGLAYADNKEYQKAIEELYEIVVRNWDSRFPEIEIFAVEEINNVVAKAGKGLDLSDIDDRLIFNMPVDVRIVLNWDTDNSDMDLWVTDPNNEKCYYKNRLTKARGMITRYYTNGYGPEAYLIKKAPKGKYIIEADYYGSSEQTLVGPTTIYLDVYTYYGTPKETKKTIMLRLESDKGEVEIGEIVF